MYPHALYTDFSRPAKFCFPLADSVEQPHLLSALRDNGPSPNPFWHFQCLDTIGWAGENASHATLGRSSLKLLTSTKMDYTQ